MMGRSQVGFGVLAAVAILHGQAPIVAARNMERINQAIAATGGASNGAEDKKPRQKK